MLLRLSVFHFDISGNDNIDVQYGNKQLILLTLLVFHFDISGNDNNDVQLQKFSTHISYFACIPF